MHLGRCRLELCDASYSGSLMPPTSPLPRPPREPQTQPWQPGQQKQTFREGGGDFEGLKCVHGGLANTGHGLVFRMRQMTSAEQ